MSTNFGPKLVFDIETIGNDFNGLDEMSKEYMLKYAEDDEERDNIKESLGFYPLTGEAVVIGILNPETQGGCVFVQNDKNKTKLPAEIDKGIKVEEGSEKEILEKFWETIKSYNCFISFNGRGFDVPFLMTRSAILGIKPTKNLMSNRYLSLQQQSAKHIDLFDQMTFYGAVRKKFNLHMWTRAFGIKSPKEEGITGYDVTDLFKKGDILKIAEYNLRDLRSTAELYEKWEKYMNI